jgi:hypothetical protein
MPDAADTIVANFAAGYLVPRQPGDDARLPCGWPRERAGG